MSDNRITAYGTEGEFWQDVFLSAIEGVTSGNRNPQQFIGHSHTKQRGSITPDDLVEWAAECADIAVQERNERQKHLQFEID